MVLEILVEKECKVDVIVERLKRVQQEYTYRGSIKTGLVFQIWILSFVPIVHLDARAVSQNLNIIQVNGLLHTALIVNKWLDNKRMNLSSIRLNKPFRSGSSDKRVGTFTSRGHLFFLRKIYTFNKLMSRQYVLLKKLFQIFWSEVTNIVR